MKQACSARCARVIALGVTSLWLASCDLFVDSNEHLDRAEALLEKGSYSEAMVEIYNADGHAADNPRGQMILARTAIQMGNLAGAEKALANAAAAGAPLDEVSAVRARLLLHAGKYADLLSGVDTNSFALDKSTTRAMRIQALAGLGRCGEALESAGTTEAGPLPNSGLIARAECIARLGNPTRARMELQAVAAKSADDAQVWMALGRLLQLEGQSAAAEKAWSNALRNAGGQLTVPQQALMYAALADLQLKRDDVEGVRGTHRKLVELAPEAPLTELVWARLELLDGADAHAVNSLRALITRVPDLNGARVLLASAYLKQGNIEQARQQLVALNQQDPSAAEFKRALTHLDELAKKGPDSEEHWMSIAAMQVTLGQPDAARAAITEARKREPGSLRAAELMAALSLQAGDPDAALRELAPLVDREPPIGTARALYGKALIAKKQFAEAAAIFEKLQARTPSAMYAIALHEVRKHGKLGDPAKPFEQWLAANPRDKAIRGIYADYLRTHAQRAAAIAQYEILLADDASNVSTMNNLAWLYHLEGDRRALALAKRAWQRAPEAASVADTYGWLLVAAGMLDEALPILKKADATHGIAEPEIRYHYAVALSRKGQRNQAARLLQELVNDVPAFESQAQAARLLADLQDPGAT